MRNLLCLTAALALVLNFACGKSKEEAAEEAVENSIEMNLGDDAEVDISDEGMAITSTDEDGTYSWQAGDQAKIPDGFPEDVHIYEAASVAMSADSPDSFTLALSTDDALPKVVGAYEEKMSAAGWTKQTSTSMNDAQMLVYTKGDRAANIGIFNEKGVTQISLTVSK